MKASFFETDTVSPVAEFRHTLRSCVLNRPVYFIFNRSIAGAWQVAFVLKYTGPYGKYQQELDKLKFGD